MAAILASAGSLSCTLKWAGASAVVELQVVFYPDGLSRQALNVAMLEIAKARRKRRGSGTGRTDR